MFTMGGRGEMNEEKSFDGTSIVVPITEDMKP